MEGYNMNWKGVGSCLEELGKTTDVSVRISGISVETPAEHILNASLGQFPLDVNIIEN
jgi:hypothetical protein